MFREINWVLWIETSFLHSREFELFLKASLTSDAVLSDQGMPLASWFVSGIGQWRVFENRTLPRDQYSRLLLLRNSTYRHLLIPWLYS